MSYYNDDIGEQLEGISSIELTVKNAGLRYAGKIINTPYFFSAINIGNLRWSFSWWKVEGHNFMFTNITFDRILQEANEDDIWELLFHLDIFRNEIY